MKRKFFINNLFLFAVPIIIPMIILGSLSIIISQNFIVQGIHTNHELFLNQIQENLEMIYKKLDTVTLTFTTEPFVAAEVKKL